MANKLTNQALMPEAEVLGKKAASGCRGELWLRLIQNDGKIQL